MAQWPEPNSQGEQQAYDNAIKAFAAYERLPANTKGPVKTVLAISGLDMSNSFFTI